MTRMLRAIPVLLLVLSLGALLLPKRAATVPLYAARTGLMCGSCHFDPNGGGPRNDFGFAFAKNRHALMPDTSGEWKDLALTNRIGDAMPVYLGVNQRFMLLANTVQKDVKLDRAGFYDMESALHIAFQPHSRLTLVYTRDGFDDGSTTKEAFGMITGLPWEGYIKAGRFRTPFGLRMDDHTVATRNGFLDFYTPDASARGFGDLIRGRFLPYDPRQPDMGVELGGARGGLSGRMALTNGGTHPLFGFANRAQAFSAKLGYTTSHYQAGFSFYDDYHPEPDFFVFPPASVGTRGTRWGYYGLGNLGRAALVYEVAAGTDAEGSQKLNTLAYFGELDYRFTAGINARFRFDRAELARGVSSVQLHDLNTHNRYALEGEFDPVPFAQIRWTLRYIDHQARTFPDGARLRDERQAYVQFHFSY